jgi:microcystin-dependent protein
VEAVTLTLNQVPSHTHQLVATAASATTPAPSAAVMIASNAGVKLYTPRAAAVATGMGTVQAGSSQAHSNMMPYLTVSFIISLFGIFPSQS